jgi:hypothetical protein
MESHRLPPFLPANDFVDQIGAGVVNGRASPFVAARLSIW